MFNVIWQIWQISCTYFPLTICSRDINAQSRKKGKKEHKYEDKSRIRANWFCETDAKEMNALTVNVIHIIYTTGCNLYMNVHPETVPCQGLSITFQTYSILCEYDSLGNIKSVYLLGNPIEHVIMVSNKNI